MSIEADVFKTYIPDFKKLKKYGFKKNKNIYFYSEQFKDKNFRADVNISDSGNILGTVFDIENGEEYFPLRIENNHGGFAAEIKDEYIRILIRIRENCFKKEFFVSAQCNRIAKLIKEKYGNEPIFMWEKFPTFGVYKNPNNDKWYGLVGYVNFAKLGESKDGMVEIINLKLDKDEIPELIKKDGIYPAYHMNKKYWVSIRTDDTLSDKELMKYIDISHKFTIKK